MVSNVLGGGAAMVGGAPGAHGIRVSEVRQLKADVYTYTTNLKK